MNEGSLSVASRRISRHDFLRRSLGVGLAGLAGAALAACASSPPPPATVASSAPTQPAQPTTAPTAASAAATTSPSAAPTLAPTAPATAATSAPAATAPASTAPVTLNLWKSPHLPGNQEVDVANKVLDQFHGANPTITVNFRLVPWAEFTQTYTAAYASDTPPDVAYMTEGISKYALPGQLEAIDDFLNQAADLKAKILPNALPSAMFSGKLYGLPWIFGGDSFLWNKTLFEQAGLDPNKPPDTWDDLVSYGAKLTKPDQGQYAYAVGPQNSLLDFGWETAFWPIQGGAQYTDADFAKCLLDSPESIAAAQFYGDLFNKHKITVPAQMGSVKGQLLSMFLAGKAAFASETDPVVPQILKEKASFPLGVGPRPKGPAALPKGRAAYGGVGYASMAAKSPNKAPSWTLMQFLVSPGALAAWPKVLGWQSVRTDVSFAEGDPIIKAVEANLPYCFLENQYLPDKPYRSDVLNEFLTEYQAIALGRKSADQAMKDATKRINDLIAAGKSSG